ncbi:MAG TPA: DedA family protein [Ktedonobacteraceae bacterium]|nr:DedA family protein [Ktedonobacteraceae bacterium]
MVWLFSTGTFFAGIPLAALITLQTLQAALDTLGYPAVTLFIMIESMGIPFPGETMLLLASFYAAINHHLQIPIVIACAALGAIIGDNLGYWIGRTGGRALVSRYGRFVFIKPEHIERAERFFEKHGNKTVFFGRFFAILRAWAAFLAGVNHMPWRTFLLYNAAGGIVWATIYGLLGYFAGRFFHDNFGQVQAIARTLSWGGAILLIVLIIALYVAYRLLKRRRRLQEQAAKDASIQNNHHDQELPPTTTIQKPAAPVASEPQHGKTDGVRQQDRKQEEIPYTEQ